MIVNTAGSPGEYDVKRAQRLRMRRFLMGVGTYIVAFMATFLVTRLGIGQLSMTQWLLLFGLGLCGPGLIFLMFYTGANLRFSEPSLTREQIIFSAIFAAVLMYWLPEARPFVLLFLLPPFSFGMLSLTLPQYLVVVGWILGIYAGLLGLEFYQERPGFDINYELVLFVLFSLLLLWFAFFGGFIYKIKRRLRTQKVETQKALDLIKIEIAERRRTEKALAESDSLRELLLDIITHDLKNPAGVILSLADHARTNLPNNKLVNEIYASSDRLLKILENTTILSQATFGEKIPLEKLNISKILEEVASEFYASLHDAGMILTIDVPQDVLISANPIIAEVLKNYISNAIKYARDGSKIIIEAHFEENAVVIAVKDFGTSIPEDLREFVFERQAQLAEGEKQGRGLGLAIVKRIAQAHHGECWVETNSPRGNSFCLRLPLHEKKQT